jgi:hypothetical protein
LRGRNSFNVTFRAPLAQLFRLTLFLPRLPFARGFASVKSAIANLAAKWGLSQEHHQNIHEVTGLGVI